MTTTPLWSMIADTLRGEIASGQYRPGDKLPTEAALARRFGVNRHTVRHALSGLIEDGTVTTRRGAGAFVSRPPTEYPLGRRVRFHQNLAAAGRLPQRVFLHIDTRNADPDEAEALAFLDSLRNDGNKAEIETRLGEDTKCAHYCGVRSVCPYGQSRAVENRLADHAVEREAAGFKVQRW